MISQKKKEVPDSCVVSPPCEGKRKRRRRSSQKSPENVDDVGPPPVVKKGKRRRASLTTKKKKLENKTVEMLTKEGGTENKVVSKKPPLISTGREGNSKGRLLEISSSDCLGLGVEPTTPLVSISVGGCKPPVPELPQSGTSSGPVVEKTTPQSTPSSDCDTSSHSVAKSIPEPNIPPTNVGTGSELSEGLILDPLQNHSDNSKEKDAQNLVGGKICDNEDPLGGLNESNQSNGTSTSQVVECSVPVSESNGMDSGHKAELDMIESNEQKDDGNRTPQSCSMGEVAKQHRGGSSTGILKHVSQFDTPCSARQGAGRRVQFSSHNDYREVNSNGKGHKTTPKQGGCGLSETNSIFTGMFLCAWEM